MKISQLKSLIKESIKEVLKENSSVSNGNVSPLTIDDWDLYNQKKKYFKGDTNLADSWLELFSDEPLNVNYRKLANEFLSNNNLNWRVVKKLSQNDEGEITWEIAPAMQERRKMSLKENSPMKGTTRAKLINHLKYWATEFSKPYADEDEMNIDYSEYRKQFAQLPEGDPLKKAYYELQDACYDQIGDYYGEGVIAKRIATAKKVAAMNFNAPAMQERRKMSLKENGSLDPKLAGYWVLKNNTQAISMYPSKQEAEMAFKNRGTKYGSHALNSGWKIVPAEEFISTGGLLDKHTTGHPNYVSPYRRPNKQQDRFDNIARSNREMER